MDALWNLLKHLLKVYSVYKHTVSLCVCVSKLLWRLFPFISLIHSPLSPNYFAQDESFHTDVPVPQLPPRTGLSCTDSTSNYATSEISAAHAENKLKSMNEAQRCVFKYSGLKHVNKAFTSKQPTLRMSVWGGALCG